MVAVTRTALLVGVLTTWGAAQEIEGIDRAPEAARELLRQNGFVVAGECTQVFEPYADPAGPVFVTVDAIAHGYAVALRALVRQLDAIAADELRRFAARLLVAAIERDRGDSSMRDVVAVAAVAHRLGGGALADVELDEDERRRIEHVVERLMAGRGAPVAIARASLWPSRFRPKAGYESSARPRRRPGTEVREPDDALQVAWRVRTFWTELAWELDEPRERELAFALCRVVAADPELRAIARSVPEPFAGLLGPPDDPDLRLGIDVVAQVEDADRFAAELENARPPRLSPAKGRRFRPFARFHTDDGAALHRASVARRDVPSGVDLLLIGPLRSEAGAAAWAANHDAPPSTFRLHEIAPIAPGEGPHGDFLRALSHLVEPPAADAPAWLRSDAWLREQCWTQLGAWAEVRHAWALHAKVAYIPQMRTDQRPGVVSPYPAFFSAIAELADRVARDAADWERQQPSRVAAGRQRVIDGAPREDLVLWRLLEAGLITAEDERRATNTWPAAVLAAAASDPDAATAEQREILRIAAADDFDAIWRLQQLAELSRRCASLATSSWSTDPLSAADRTFLLGFGEALAYVCGYASVSRPEDDVPVVVTVARSEESTNLALQVGVGRPENLWALVPDGDRLVVHQGAVLTYRETTVRADHGELDDQAWRAAARTGELPAPPAFTRTFR